MKAITNAIHAEQIIRVYPSPYRMRFRRVIREPPKVSQRPWRNNENFATENIINPAIARMIQLIMNRLGPAWAIFPKIKNGTNINVSDNIGQPAAVARFACSQKPIFFFIGFSFVSMMEIFLKTIYYPRAKLFPTSLFCTNKRNHRL